MKPNPRADHIGSLQRPAKLLAEVHKIYDKGGSNVLFGEDRDQNLGPLHAIEDETIRDVVRKQEDLGLQILTDGEFRRVAYFNSFYDAVSGVSEGTFKLDFRNDDGEVIAATGPAAISGKLSKIDSPAKREMEFLRPLTDRPLKVTFPTASFLIAQAALGPAVSPDVYASPDEAADAIVGVLRELADDAIAGGANYVQFDTTGYHIALRTPAAKAFEAKGIDVSTLVDRMQAADRAVIEGMPDDVTTCMHDCRGNYGSGYLFDYDGLDDMGDLLFGLPYDRFAIEWDGFVERGEPDYKALETVKDNGATVILGVVSTRHPELETADEIKKKVERASKHIPLEQLAISPQCGFSSALGIGEGQPDGNLIDEDTQWRKLDLLVKTADEIWG